VLAASGLEHAVRKHPLAAAATAACVGALGGPFLLRALPRIARAAGSKAQAGDISSLAAAAAAVSVRLLRTRRNDAG